MNQIVIIKQMGQRERNENNHIVFNVSSDDSMSVFTQSG